MDSNPPVDLGLAGIGLGADTPEKLCMNIRKNKKALSRWTRTKVLIMDEGEV